MSANRNPLASEADLRFGSGDAEFWAGESTLSHPDEQSVPTKRAGKKRAGRATALDPAYETSTEPQAVPLPRGGKSAAGSDHQRLAAATLFKAGFGYKFVASSLGISIYTARTWLRQWKKNAFSVDPYVQKIFPESVKERVYALRREGKSWTAIAEETGVSRTSCRNWCLRAGVKPEEVAPRANPVRSRKVASGSSSSKR